jgi:hypothetical protein
MNLTVELRLFAVSNPVESMETAGALSLGDDAPEELNLEGPDKHHDAFQQYMDSEFENFLAEQPAPQAVYDGIAVVLESILIDVTEDDVEYRYDVHVPDAQAICTEKTDVETGLVAGRSVPDDRLADGMQRSADAVDHRFEWLDVISPRSLAGIADAAEDLVSDNPEEPDDDH